MNKGMLAMQRYFVSGSQWCEENVHITGEDAHHITRVMRFNVGDHIICNHPGGSVAECEIDSLSHDSVIATIIHWKEESAELPVDVTIIQALPKGDKIEFTMQKGTELGACEFIPFTADRSIVKWDDKKKDKKQRRFLKIVKEASEQCHRNKIPDVQPVMSLEDAIKFVEGYDVKLFAHTDEARTDDFQSLAHSLKQTFHNHRIVICVGPEGGFSEQEVALLKKQHFSPVRMGPRILRTETAALYALASISYHFEELRWNLCQQ